MINFLFFLYNGKYPFLIQATGAHYWDSLLGCLTLTKNPYRYMSLVDRLVRMRLTYARPSVARYVNFEFMNRQLVWTGFAVRGRFSLSGFTKHKLKIDSMEQTCSVKQRFILFFKCVQEFLMFLTPLINVDKMKRWIYRLFRVRSPLHASLPEDACGEYLHCQYSLCLNSCNLI